ncbi:MAG: HNH endonuclease [Treponema sp.]|nr:HNH endonuclease [Treponema sp.]
MKKYLCRFPGCSALLDAPGHCPKHKPPPSRPGPAFVNAGRPNAHLYNTAAWRRLKREKLLDQPYCSRCGIAKGPGVRLECHHIRPPRGDQDRFFDPDNLEVVCPACHRVITAQEIHRRRR